jgi:hypothetical protein
VPPTPRGIRRCRERAGRAIAEAVPGRQRRRPEALSQSGGSGSSRRIHHHSRSRPGRPTHPRPLRFAPAEVAATERRARGEFLKSLQASGDASRAERAAEAKTRTSGERSMAVGTMPIQSALRVMAPRGSD